MRLAGYRLGGTGLGRGKSSPQNIVQNPGQFVLCTGVGKLQERENRPEKKRTGKWDIQIYRAEEAAGSGDSRRVKRQASTTARHPPMSLPAI